MPKHIASRTAMRHKWQTHHQAKSSIAKHAWLAKPASHSFFVLRGFLVLVAVAFGLAFVINLARTRRAGCLASGFGVLAGVEGLLVGGVLGRRVGGSAGRFWVGSLAWVVAVACRRRTCCWSSVCCCICCF